VSLAGISDIRGVNAIAHGAELEFAPTGLTIVGGWNASGKTGYVRILKRVCWSRAPRQPVLGNVISKDGVEPSATIHFSSDGIEGASAWSPEDESKNDQLSRISVFDGHAARVHVEGRNPMLFMPASLDLLRGAVVACEQVSGRLSDRLRMNELRARDWSHLRVGRIEAALDALGTSAGIEQLRELASLSPAGLAALESLPKQIAELATTDPARRAAECGVRASQLTRLSSDMGVIAAAIAAGVTDRLLAVDQELADVDEALKLASEDAFSGEPLPGIGSEQWRLLWNAASTYSKEIAYPDHGFPHLDNAVCVLCQQELADEARSRLERFRDAVAGELHERRRRLGVEREDIRNSLGLLPLGDKVNSPALDVLGIVDAGLKLEVDGFFGTTSSLVANVLQTPEGSGGTDESSLAIGEEPDGPALAAAVEELAARERDEVQRLSMLDPSAARVAELSESLAELKARIQLKDSLTEVFADHDRLVAAGIIKSAQKLCGTQALTMKVKALASSNVESIMEAFAREISNYELTEARVALTLDRSEKGVSYLKVELVGAEDTPAGDVLSEGERQVVALSGFLADLSTVGDSSALVFDDPMSSLDHRHRESLARRLLVEAQKRQVIVFTHDTVFMNALFGAVDEWEKRLAAGVATDGPVPSITTRHLVRNADGAGVVDDRAGWRDPATKERLRAIDAEWAEAKALHESHDEAGYEAAAKHLLGHLRETWERAVEEVLLHDIVQRNRRAVKTSELRYLIGITDEEIAGVDLGMSVESRFFAGHDDPIGDETPVRPPAWLYDEIQHLRTWMKSVHKRQG
jgi:recombinational DNA repair ATPase RecF